jgi:hypothetical protein
MTGLSLQVRCKRTWLFTLNEKNPVYCAIKTASAIMTSNALSICPVSLKRSLGENVTEKCEIVQRWQEIERGIAPLIFAG